MRNSSAQWTYRAFCHQLVFHPLRCREQGLKQGYSRKNIRGEDVRLCCDLMKYGKVRFVRSNKAIAWTKERNFEKDDGFKEALKKRLLTELLRFKNCFKTAPRHTKEQAKRMIKMKMTKKKKEL